ncbi:MULTISPECIES: hypothetical protein [Streptomyces]|uniref:hypothetical protein n=1 Tax=Streptomyces TaxID=1883 RepID=UPI000A3BFE58|nr:hypothetical protein [Streptomyces viridochromogenes]
MARQPDNSSNPQGASPERGVLDEALEPEQIKSLNSALRKLSQTDNVSKDLQESAKRMLSGRLALRDALDDPAFARAFGSGGLASLRGQWESLPEEERDRLRHGEPLQGDADGTGQKDPQGRPSEPGGKKPGGGRHSGGFSLY